MTIAELKTKLAAAIANGDDSTFMECVAEIAKQKKELAKAEAERLAREAESLAKVREALGKELHKAIKALNLKGKLDEVKASGFTFKLDTVDKDGVPIIYKSVELLVPTTKKRSGGGTSGGGKSKDEYGMSLGDIFDKFATAEDKAELEAAETNSKQWQIKTKVKKAALAAGLLQPVK